MNLPASEWLVDRVAQLIGAIKPGFLARDTLKMCWSPTPNVGSSEVAQGYTLRRVSTSGIPEGWIDTLCSAGLGVTEETWRQDLAEGRDPAVHAVYHAGSLVATAAIRPVADHPDKGCLLWVGVTPGHQGKALGRVVVEATQRTAVERGYSEMFLMTEDHRLPAIKLYLSLGFRPCLNSWDRTQHYRWQRIGRKLGVAMVYCRSAAHRAAVADLLR